MMYKEKDHRDHRILSIYERLVKGKVLNKEQLALEFGVNNKSIQRDIEQIKFYLANQPEYASLELKYSRKYRGYQLLGSENQNLKREGLLAMVKILLASRAFNEKEMNYLKERLSLKYVLELFAIIYLPIFSFGIFAPSEIFFVNIAYPFLFPLML